MSLFGDIGSLTNNEFLTGLGNTSIGVKYGDKITSSIQKRISPTPKPAPVAAPTIQTSTFVDVADPDNMKGKVLVGVGAFISFLIVVYFVKKRKNK